MLDALLDELEEEAAQIGAVNTIYKRDDGRLIGAYLQVGRGGFIELFLMDLLLKAVGRELATELHISFHEMDGKDVCRVVVGPSPHPVFLKEGGEETFWLRTGNSTRKLSVKEAVGYSKSRW